MLSKEFNALFEPHRIDNNNPMEIHYEGCCSWAGFGILPATGNKSSISIHVYSWDPMSDCVRYGFTHSIHPTDTNDYEIHSKKP